jgi:two-component system sensor histidine kinase AtoS
MKKKLIYLFSLLFLFFLTGVLISIFHIYSITKELRVVVNLHRIEIIRKNLLINLQTVQGNLYTMGTVFGEELDVIVENVRAMDESMHNCLSCHHSAEMTERLKKLVELNEQYKEAISRFITSTENPDRILRLKILAVGIGNDLLKQMHDLTFLTDKSLSAKTIQAINDMDKSRYILFFTIISALFVCIIIAVSLVKTITKPINELVKAAREIRLGNLNYRVSYDDKTEFGELARSFNEMAFVLDKNISEIEESEKKYRQLFENAKDGIFVVDAEGTSMGNIVSANKAAAGLHNYSIDELLSLNIRDLIDSKDIKKFDEMSDNVLMGRPVAIELQCYRKNGETFPAEISASLLDIKNHKYILLFLRDITDRKESEERLMRTETMKICGELTTGLAHEIKNPLAGIKSSMQLFLETIKLSEEEREILQMAINEIKKIESLIKEILNFARPPKPQFTDVNINELLDYVLSFSIQSVSSVLKSPQLLSIEKDFAENIPNIIADPLQLNQSFLNIILNALEEMSEGGTLRIKTLYDASENTVRIYISDTGKGIRKDIMEKLFQPFSTSKPKGTGLGLAITKRLVELHGGKITAMNNPDRGATFIVSLPIDRENKDRNVNGIH